MDKTFNPTLSSSINENTFWNYFLLIVLIVIIVSIFFKHTEHFTGLFTSFNPLPKLSNIPKEIKNELTQELTNNQNNQDTLYPNLTDTKPFSSKEKKVHFLDNINEFKLNNNINMDINMDMDIYNDNTNITTDGSTRLMNQIGIHGKPKSHNLLGIKETDMNEYKNNFYSMYAHQIECPDKCNLNSNGSMRCGISKNNASKSNPDAFVLNYMALNNLNKKSCVTCNFKPKTKSLNRGMDNISNSYVDLDESLKKADEARLKKVNLIDANISNYVNFENNVYQNSIGETSPDRINEIRTCQDVNGTCSLKNYGTSIANVYDKLTTNPSYNLRNSYNSYQLTGILEDSAPTDMYANV